MTYSDSSVDGTVHILQLVMGLAMLIAPLWILKSVDSTTTRLASISGFIVIFLLLVSFLTPCRVYEAFGATAA